MERRSTAGRRRWPIVAVGALIALVGLAQLKDRFSVSVELSEPVVSLLLLAVGGVLIGSGADRRDIRRGAILVVVGLWLLVSASGMAGFSYANSWPLLLIGIGVVSTIVPSEESRGRISGIMLIAWGGLFWIAVRGLWGLGWSTIWPFFIVVFGLELVWNAVTDQRRNATPTGPPDE